MGLIKDMIVNAAASAAKEATRDLAVGAAAGVITAVTAVSAATVKGAKYVVKGASAAAKGVTSAVNAVGDGINRASEYIRKISDPINQKKVAVLKEKCSELILLSDEKGKEGHVIYCYTGDIELCMTFTQKKDLCKLAGIDDSLIASFKREKTLFTTRIIVTLMDGTKYVFTSNDSKESNIKYKFGDSFFISRNNILSDYDIYYGNEIIASIKSKPISEVDCAILIQNDNYDAEIMAIAICKLIF